MPIPALTVIVPPPGYDLVDVPSAHLGNADGAVIVMKQFGPGPVDNSELVPGQIRGPANDRLLFDIVKDVLRPDRHC